MPPAATQRPMHTAWMLPNAYLTHAYTYVYRIESNENICITVEMAESKPNHGDDDDDYLHERREDQQLRAIREILPTLYSMQIECALFFSSSTHMQ